MTNRERMLALIQGREHDRVPFVQYSGLAAPNEEVWKLLGRNRLGILKWSAVHTIRYPNCKSESVDFERDGQRWRRTTTHTPGGAIFEERCFEPAYNSSSVRKHYVETPADLEVLIALLEDAVVEENLEQYRNDVEFCGDDGWPLVATGRSPYQQLWVQWTGIDHLAYLMADCPDRVAAVMDLLTRQLRSIFELCAQSEAPFVDISDNITAPAIGPSYFRKYCVPLYDELADMLSDRGALVFVHMDGDLKPLWPAIAESKVRGIDSFSPAPDNDTRVADAVRLWPEMRLWVNFPSSVHLRPYEQVYRQAMTILSEAGHTGRLQIQVSENVPRDRWRTSYRAIAQAIDDYGPPGIPGNG